MKDEGSRCLMVTASVFVRRGTRHSSLSHTHEESGDVGYKGNLLVLMRYGNRSGGKTEGHVSPVEGSVLGFGSSSAAETSHVFEELNTTPM